MQITFEWDENKEKANLKKHGVDFQTAQYAFADPKLIVAVDTSHSVDEQRFFCFGKIQGKILSVRFTYRNTIIRIIGAGY